MSKENNSTNNNNSDGLPPPSVVEAINFEAIVADIKDNVLDIAPSLADVIGLESEPITKLIEAFAYREMLYRERVNQAARAHMLAFAVGDDLDNKGAFYGVVRQEGEGDDRYRVRIVLKIYALAAQGTSQHYEYVAMTATDQVQAAHALQIKPGSVCVLVRCIPAVTTPEQAQQVLDVVHRALMLPHNRMLGVTISTALAQPKPIDITAKIQLAQNAPINWLTSLADALRQALSEQPQLGQPIARSWLTAILQQAGVISITYPDAQAPSDITPMAPNEYATAGEIKLIEVSAA